MFTPAIIRTLKMFILVVFEFSLNFVRLYIRSLVRSFIHVKLRNFGAGDVWP